MNCSGKHAAMLATCVANGWDTATYLAPDHPAPARIAGDFCALDRRAGRRRRHGRVRRPAALDLSDRAGPRVRGAGPLIVEGPGLAVATAIRSHPEFVSGTHRDELTLLRAIPGAIGKAGAESVYAIALPDGRAFAPRRMTARRGPVPS